MVTNKFVAKLLEDFQAEREAWANERRELLNRIQAPERIPVSPGEVVQWDLPEDAQELAKVGQLFPEDPEENGNAG